MNSTCPRRVRTATFATVVAFVACASTGSPASAAHPHANGDEGGRITGANSVSPYAEPIAALDGMTLAQYIQQHLAGDRRMSTVV